VNWRRVHSDLRDPFEDEEDADADAQEGEAEVLSVDRHG